MTTFYSNFEHKVLEIDDRLAIGLEMFLGKENALIKQLPNIYPQYLKNKWKTIPCIKCVLWISIQQVL